MKMVVFTVVLAGAIIGGIIYQSKNTKAPTVPYKWGKEPPSIVFKEAPKGMSDQEIMRHNQEALRQANGRK